MTPASALGEVRPEHDANGEPSQLVQLYYVRGYALPIVDVWEYLTEPDRLATWFGTVDGDPFSGDVTVTMAADSQNETAPVHVEACTAPHLLDVTVADANVDLRLHQVGVVTSLFVHRRHLDPKDVGRVGPYWQFYLDRLEASIGGTAMPSWSDYENLAAEYPLPG